MLIRRAYSPGTQILRLSTLITRFFHSALEHQTSSRLQNRDCAGIRACSRLRACVAVRLKIETQHELNTTRSAWYQLCRLTFTGWTIASACLLLWAVRSSATASTTSGK